MVAAAAARHVSAADDERGRPLLRSFGRHEHKAPALFHAPFISPAGLDYAGSQLALMEYDGRTWRILKIPLTSTRALGPGPGGELYVGDDDKLGGVPRLGSGAAEFRCLLAACPPTPNLSGRSARPVKTPTGSGPRNSSPTSPPSAPRLHRPTSRDAAVSAGITTRDNSVRVTGGGGATGRMIAEIYDATPAANFAVTTPPLFNVSVRTNLGSVGGAVVDPLLTCSTTGPSKSAKTTTGPARPNSPPRSPASAPSPSRPPPRKMRPSSSRSRRGAARSKPAA